ncbi:MAG: ferredoxin--NADP reductase [Pseudomonadota bacterium]
MAAFNTETVTEVHHWTDRLLSFKTTRQPSFRFENGHFTMIGLERDGRKITRAYSIVSPNYEEFLEFLSIKVPDGALTSKLKELEVGDQVLVSTKPTGTLTIDQVLPGRRLYLLGTGTGLAPFLSIIRDPETYTHFEHVVLVHGTRYVSDLAYREYIEKELPANPYFGELVREKLRYFPAVTRETFQNEGRITQLLESGQLTAELGLPDLSVDDDRVMICGSPAVLSDLSALLDARGFNLTRSREIGEYAIERSFVEK